VPRLQHQWWRGLISRATATADNVIVLVVGFCSKRVKKLILWRGSSDPRVKRNRQFDRFYEFPYAILMNNRQIG
jgi:hypothetical protein